MKIVESRDRAPWGPADAALFWLKRVAQWLCQPLLRWTVYICRHGVPPPAMVFPDAPKNRAQFPPLSSLGSVSPSAPALELWKEGATPARYPVDPARPGSIGQPEQADRLSNLPKG